jgi:hypothetical protein
MIGTGDGNAEACPGKSPRGVVALEHKLQKKLDKSTVIIENYPPEFFQMRIYADLRNGAITKWGISSILRMKIVNRTAF